MLEKIPKTVPIDFGTSHGNELLNFFDTCRRRGIGTDIELTVNGEKLKGISLFTESKLLNFRILSDALYFKCPTLTPPRLVDRSP